MFPMQLLTLEKLVAVDIFWSRLCSPKVKTKRKGDDCFVPGQGGPGHLLQAESESFRGKHEGFPMFLILWCPLSSCTISL